jgi:hypothetical protein
MRTPNPNSKPIAAPSDRCATTFSPIKQAKLAM